MTNHYDNTNTMSKNASTRPPFKPGVFVNGQWLCDCEPRGVAKHFQAKSPENKGKWFYVCPISEGGNNPDRCKFFIWEEEARQREAAARATERYGNNNSNSTNFPPSTAPPQGPRTPPTPQTPRKRRLSAGDADDDTTRRKPATPGGDPMVISDTEGQGNNNNGRAEDGSETDFASDPDLDEGMARAADAADAHANFFTPRAQRTRESGAPLTPPDTRRGTMSTAKGKRKSVVFASGPSSSSAAPPDLTGIVAGTPTPTRTRNISGTTADAHQSLNSVLDSDLLAHLQDALPNGFNSRLIEDKQRQLKNIDDEKARIMKNRKKGAIADYNVQLALLEIENKRRLLIHELDAQIRALTGLQVGSTAPGLPRPQPGWPEYARLGKQAPVDVPEQPQEESPPSSNPVDSFPSLTGTINTGVNPKIGGSVFTEWLKSIQAHGLQRMQDSNITESDMLTSMDIPDLRATAHDLRRAGPSSANVAQGGPAGASRPSAAPGEQEPDSARLREMLLRHRSELNALYEIRAQADTASSRGALMLALDELSSRVAELERERDADRAALAAKDDQIAVLHTRIAAITAAANSASERLGSMMDHLNA